MTTSFKLTLMWLLAALAALVVGLAPVSGAFVDGHFIPVGPDGFYHARRILDAVADPSAFFQYDTLTHVPEGNLITWPWFYDYVMSLLVRLMLALHLARDPMTALVHIPVLLFTLAPLLVMSIARKLEMPLGLTLLAMLATAFFPLNQSIYSVGNIDHHYCEHLFVLGTLNATLGWLLRPQSRAWAILCGATFGAATGIHSALFILQLPLLGTFLLLWLRRQPLPRHTGAFALALVAVQLAIALPSLPLQLGSFNYYMLSWFQPYVAACTGVAVVLLARLPRTGRGLAIFGGASLLLLLPTLHQVLYAGDFFSNSIGGMGDLMEVRSVLQLAKDTSFTFVAENYTWLIVLLPATALLCAWWLWRPRTPLQAHFALTALAGLVLLPMQARLQYFGSFALYMPWLLAIGQRWHAPRTRVLATGAAALVVLAASLQGLQQRVFSPHVLSEEPNYSATYQMYAPLAARCADEPGLVLADPSEGHYLRFHTRCSVIANNFLVTPHDVAKWNEAQRLLNLPANRLADAAPEVRYVFVQRATIFVLGADGKLKFAPGEYGDHPEYPLVHELLGVEESSLPAGFELIFEMRQSPADPPFARVLAVRRSPRSELPR
jgi:hypothetical protein